MARVGASTGRAFCLAAASAALAGALALAGLGGAGTGLRAIARGALLVELLLLALALGVAGLARGGPGDLLGWGTSRLGGRVKALLVVATLATSHALDGLLSLLELREQSVLGDLAAALAGIRGVDLALAVGALVLMPAFAEELLCRGVVQRGLARRLRPALAIAASSALFALLHGEAIHALLAAPLGLHLGVVAWWGDSTRPAVLCHAANNLGAILLGAWAVEPPGPAALHVAAGLLIAGVSWLAALGLGRRGQSGLQPGPGVDDG